MASIAFPCVNQKHSGSAYGLVRGLVVGERSPRRVTERTSQTSVSGMSESLFRIELAQVHAPPGTYPSRSCLVITGMDSEAGP